VNSLKNVKKLNINKTRVNAEKNFYFGVVEQNIVNMYYKHILQIY